MHLITKLLRLKTIALVTLLIPALLAPVAFAADDLPKTVEKIPFEGRTIYRYAPPKPAPGKPWVWFFPTLNGLSLSMRKVYYEGLLNAGITIAGYDLGEVRGADGSTKQFTRFYNEMVRLGYSPKPILIGQSRGGLMSLAWAIQNPEKTQALVGIYPVFSLKTWGLKNMPVTLADYKVTQEEIRANIAKYDPIDNLTPLIERKLPVFIVQGLADKGVPYEENTKIVEDAFKAGNAPITVKLFPGIGHAALPEYFENQELLNFMLTHAKLSTQK